LLTAITGDPTRRIFARRSVVKQFDETPVESSDGYNSFEVRVRAASGLEFDMSIRWPMDDVGVPGGVPRPLVLILGGQKSGQRAAHLVKDTKGAIVAAISYPYHVRPWPSGAGIFLGLHKIHTALLDTPSAIMVALDYLQMRRDLCYETVDLVGVSLGVPFVCVAAALDQRFDRVWSIHGAGQPYKLLEHNLRLGYEFGPLRKLLAGFAHLVGSGRALAPERWVARISPRPFLMINAINDHRIPRSAALSLFRSAREPKEIHWMDGDHVAVDRDDVIERLCDLIFTRVTRFAGEATSA
jgi:hypothetical protein